MAENWPEQRRRLERTNFSVQSTKDIRAALANIDRLTFACQCALAGEPHAKKTITDALASVKGTPS